jgi:hypothetical protein
MNNLFILLFFFVCFITIWNCFTTSIETISSTQIAKCGFIFIDGGSNVGDTISKFSAVLSSSPNFGSFNRFQIELGISQWLKKYSYDSQMRKKEICVFGVEGNAKFSTTLKIAEKNCSEENFYCKIFVESVITAENRANQTVYLQVDPSERSIASSIVHLKQVESQKVLMQPAVGISISSLVHPHLKEHGHVLLKLDIEGRKSFYFLQLFQTFYIVIEALNMKPFSACWIPTFVNS